MVDFSEGPHPGGFNAPMRFEAEILDCEVEGEIPAELDGIFVRTGPDWYYPPLYPHDAPFSADGYVSAFRISNGRASYRGKFVRTPRFVNNLDAGRQLYGVYRNPFTDDPAIREQSMERPWERTSANTTPMVQGGRLFALKEDAPPIEIDPNTLETRGFYDWSGQYSSQTHTAHPKPDPMTGDMWTFGYEATGLCSDDVFFYRISPEGEIKHEIRIKVPYVSMMHDLIITNEHIVIPVFSYFTNMERLREGQVHWGWDASLPGYFGVMRRDGDGSDLKWYDAPSGTVIVHTLNGFSDGGRLVMEAPEFDTNPFGFFPSEQGGGGGPIPRSQLRRFTFDLDRGSFEKEVVFNNPISDLVRVDDRYLMQPHRYCFTQYSESGGEDRGTGYMKLDVHTGEHSVWYAGQGQSLNEVSFVPRSADAPEGDGYLVGVANNVPEMRSEFVIVDASDMKQQARVILPFRASAQVHARWFQANELPEMT